MNPFDPCSEPNFWLSCILIDRGCKVTPEEIRLALEKENIEARPIWKPMHLQPVYAGRDFISLGEDVGGDIFARSLCLPSDIKMTPEDVEAVMDIIGAI